MSTVRSNSVTLLVGDTGTGKTSLLATYADWVWQKHKKITLLYTSDGGGFGTSIEALIKKGIIWVWKMRTRGHAFETCARASQGYWPAQIDPESGETSPGCTLLPATQTEYTLFCSEGHKVMTKTNRNAFAIGVLCKECKKKVTLKTGTIKEKSQRTAGFENVGGVCLDGLTSMSNWIMQDMAKRAGNLELKGEESALGGRIADGEMFFGGNNRSHYGFAQVRAEEWLNNTTTIPGLVAPPIYTAREEKGTDSTSRLAVYGPKIAGSAKTAEVPSWVGNCLGTCIMTDDKGNPEWRLYLTQYRETDGIPHLCKTRAMPGMMPDFLSDVYGEYFTVFNLGHFFDLLDSALEQTIKNSDQKYTDAPGLPQSLLSLQPKKEVVPIKNPTVRPVANPVPKVAKPLPKPGMVRPPNKPLRPARTIQQTNGGTNGKH